MSKQVPEDGEDEEETQSESVRSHESADIDDIYTALKRIKKDLVEKKKEEKAARKEEDGGNSKDI